MSISKTATIARGLGAAALAAPVAAIALSQIGLAPMVGFGVFQLGILFGLVALVTGGVALFLTGPDKADGRDRAYTGLGLGVAMVIIVLLSIGDGGQVPPINDITTNLDDPPSFAQASAGHANAGRDMSYPPDFVAQVRDAYGDLAPIAIGLSEAETYELALQKAKQLGWEITKQDPQAHTFEAEDTTALFRFVDDVSIRVRAASQGRSVVDVRSKSRDGQGDLGANAERIRTFAAALNAPKGVAAR